MLYILIIFAGCLLLFWIPTLIYGIVRVRRHKDTLGIFLTVFSSLWGLFAIIVIGFISFFAFVFYSIRNDMKVEQFDSANYKGETGIIRIDSKYQATAQFYNLSKREKYRVATDKGQFILPVGQWQFHHLELVAEDKNNSKWHAYINSNYHPQTLAVSHNKPVSLNAGPPFTAFVTSRKRGQFYTFSFNLKDRGNNRTTIRKSYSSPPPSFQLIAPDGKILLDKRFKYG